MKGSKEVKTPVFTDYDPSALYSHVRFYQNTVSLLGQWSKVRPLTPSEWRLLAKASWAINANPKVHEWDGKEYDPTPSFFTEEEFHEKFAKFGF